MKFIPVNELPENGPRCENKPTKEFLLEFIETGAPYARVVLGKYDYVNEHTAYTSFRTVSKYHKLPVAVAMMGGEIYLIRKDF